MNFDPLEFKHSILEQTTLNSLLDLLETDISKIGQADASQSLKTLLKLDCASEMVAELRVQGREPKAEIAQLDYIADSLERLAGRFIKDIGGAEAFLRYKKQFADKPDARWWNLDSTLRQQRMQNFRRAIFMAGTLGILLGAVMLIYQIFLAPDPITIQRYNLEIAADQAMQDGNYQAALEKLLAAQNISPNDGSILVQLGIIEEKLGDSAKSMEYFGSAQQAIGNPEQYFLFRGETRLKIGDFAGARLEALQVVKINSESAEGHFLLARSCTLLNRPNEAIEAFQTASELANKQGKQELNASIRVTMAMYMQNVLQAVPTIPPEGGSPTKTP